MRTQGGDFWSEFEPLLWVLFLSFFLVKVDFPGKGQKYLFGVDGNLEIKKIDNILAYR